MENVFPFTTLLCLYFCPYFLLVYTLSRMIDEDLFEPYQKLIEIEVLGQRVKVPENNKLLRCFQYLSIETISYGDFCWNGECTNCQVWYQIEEDGEVKERTTLSCRTKASEGMSITKLSKHIRLKGVIGSGESKELLEPEDSPDSKTRQTC